ncbi:MAG: AEC family transporter, partial [Gammaproteobacteria bacterium]|nr:AEC family transporter [Gammaproteobacteria bacterium]NIR68245.1 AEC family transporter [candidate division Zixibacteria bacterium]NIR96302.1 AEC family transporter [Gammaproteobacteria bacterium]NIU17496.1 AEC family transporter [candidate division Zixibacteria bacterium]NIV09635.1 AEC family transporter [candidate division Zixibacteria bacterium]
MPSMVIGIVICDHYKLDTGIYAAAVTVTTLLSLISLPLWFNWLT